MAKLGEGLQFTYEPILEQAPMDKNFHYLVESEDGTKEIKMKIDGFKLITDINELKTYVEKCKGKVIGFDTETTGLTYGEDKIVGFSISLDDLSGFYVPIRHQNRTAIKTKVDKVDENGNQVLTKTGKVATKTITTYEYSDCEENVNPKEALDTLYEILTGAKTVLMHNSEFDLNMLKFEGYDILKINSFDNLILPYLYDPEATGLAGLKALEKRVLGREVPEFKDVLGKDAENFAFVKPEDGYVYACCDTAGLIGVFNKMYPLVTNLLSKFKKPLTFNGKPYNVINKDNNLVKAFVDYYGHAKILIDRNKAIKYKEQLEAEQKKVINEIYSFFDKGMFNLSTSSLEFKEVMASKNLYTGVKTDKGGDSWSKKAAGEMKRNLNKVKECMDAWSTINFQDSILSKSGLGFQLYQMLKLYGSEYFKLKLDTKNEVKVLSLDGNTLDFKPFWRQVQTMYNGEMEKLRILMLIQKNNSLNKALNSYVDKLTQVDECFMRYRLKGTKSGRLSSGNGSKSDKRKNHYYIDLNAQNLTKPASSYYVAEKCESNDPENILGWKFTPVATDYAMEHLNDLYIVEGQDSGITIRGCLKAPEGETEWAWVTRSSVPQLPEGAQEGEIELFKVSLSEGDSIVCSNSTIFRTLYRGKEQPFTIKQLVPCKDEYSIIGSHKAQLGKIMNVESLGVQKALKLPKGKYTIGSFLVYSGIHLGKRYVVSLDYDAQEYKLMAILSQDSKMLENFRKGIDPHTASAYAIWGEENYDKSKRKKAKIFNFLNNYSGGAYTLSQQLDIPLKDAEQMIEKYNETFWEMVDWKNKEINDMKMNDYVVFNAFGRPRQFKGWMKTINKNNDLMYTNLVQKDEIQKASNRVAAAVERRVSSHIIQGTAGDILRLVLSDLYKKYFKVRNPQIDFLSTVHDEINYTIDTKVATDYIRELEDLMTFDALSKELPITTSTDVGFTYGNMFPFVWEDPKTKETLIPKRVHHA